MKTLEIIGVVLFLVGIFLIIVQPFNSMTGAVIDLSGYGKVNFLVGLLFIVIGVVLFVVKRK